jgi:hypothetical protein
MEENRIYYINTILKTKEDDKYFILIDHKEFFIFNEFNEIIKVKKYVPVVHLYGTEGFNKCIGSAKRATSVVVKIHMDNATRMI